MSLRIFHLFFIFVSIVCAFGYGAWCVKESLRTADSSQMVIAVIAFLAGVGLIVYGVKVRRKLMNVGPR
jgi:membrane protein YdbS with pleckstrin-like domain